MKKIVVAILIATIFMVAMGKINTYQMQGTVTDRDEITDKAGRPWEYSTNGFRVGDTVTITFHDRGTTNRGDDIVKEVK